ncbi:hypothetical protein B296_00033173 [Ensete ventricosum]|uniref:DUF3700 domain-containing protein n=1 Tax=Ensete ventricosum TaxID=4639 RepID=A0A426X6M6_ENSVE|nr:hypothetical protein B296_00033173 [Ensete ventricosum]
MAVGSRTACPKTPASELVRHFVNSTPGVVLLKVGGVGNLAFCPIGQPSIRTRFAAEDEIQCIFKGVLTNMGSLRQQYGLAKCYDEALMVIKAYKDLRERSPYPPYSMLSHLSGSFAFVLCDLMSSTILVASDVDGMLVRLFWGITSDGFVAFSDDLELLKASCGKSLAPFPQGCFYSNTLGGLQSYGSPRDRVIAVLENEEEIFGVTFKVLLIPTL